MSKTQRSRKPATIHVMDTSVDFIVGKLPFRMDSFTRVSCSRERATVFQRRIYSLNKNHVHGHVVATRYDAAQAELIMWRMA